MRINLARLFSYTRRLEDDLGGERQARARDAGESHKAHVLALEIWHAASQDRVDAAERRFDVEVDRLLAQFDCERAAYRARIDRLTDDLDAVNKERAWLQDRLLIKVGAAPIAAPSPGEVVQREESAKSRPVVGGPRTQAAAVASEHRRRMEQQVKNEVSDFRARRVAVPQPD